MKFCTDIHGPQRMNPVDSGDPLIVPVAPRAGQNDQLSCEISQFVLNELAQVS